MVSTQLLKSFNAPKAEYCTGGIHFGIHGNDLLKEVNNWVSNTRTNIGLRLQVGYRASYIWNR
jgi:hypothetical protein